MYQFLKSINFFFKRTKPFLFPTFQNAFTSRPLLPEIKKDVLPALLLSNVAFCATVIIGRRSHTATITEQNRSANTCHNLLDLVKFLITLATTPLAFANLQS